MYMHVKPITLLGLAKHLTSQLQNIFIQILKTSLYFERVIVQKPADLTAKNPPKNSQE